jgi:hypothetical protein
MTYFPSVDRGSRRIGVVVGSSAVVVLLGSLCAPAQGTGYRVSLAGPASDPLTGSAFHLSGRVSPAAAGQVVRLQRRVDGHFRRVATAIMASDGSYAFTRTGTVGRYVYRVKVPATISAVAAYSPAAQVFVTTRFIRRGVTRAQSWVDAHVPYSQSDTYTNRFGTYRRDCSGYVSMAWALPSSYTTATLPRVSYAVTRTQLRRGDLLLHLATRGTAGHVVLFDSWADAGHSTYVAYEETPGSGATRHTIPYPYWGGHGTYAPYRRDGT